jgi:solute carrier family 25 (mitochondrial S-adenosylmethionine transporter), member 26
VSWFSVSQNVLCVLFFFPSLAGIYNKKHRDTLKTRLQSPVGFLKAGGFRGIYNGLGAAAIGSAPGAALFFSTYERMKPVVSRWQSSYSHTNDTNNFCNNNNPAVSHMMAASIAEAVACLVRVPTEVVKAKMQTANQCTTGSTPPLSLQGTVRAVLKERHGGMLSSSRIMGGLYRGYGITLFREIPFAMIQFPFYEWLKVEWSEQRNQGIPVSALQSATCGSVSGAVAAAITTPLDVIKTRLMLGADREGRVYHGVVDVFRRTIQADGQSALWSGIQPRVLWITMGGFVFFGAYEESKSLLAPFLER